jgi:glycosyltransferase involved in cell wall biosynthesis
MALLLTRNNLPLARALAAAGADLRWTVLTKEDLRGRGPRYLLARLREAPWAVCVFEDDAAEIARRGGLHHALLALARGRSRWVVASGGDAGLRAQRVRPSRILPSLAWKAVLEIATTTAAVARGWRLARSLAGAAPGGPRALPGPRCRRVAVLRTDFWFQATAGGSVTHALGVLGAMRRLGLHPGFWTTTRLPAPQGSLEQRLVRPAPRPSWLEDAAIAGFNRTFLRETEAEIRDFGPSVIYQRHSVLSLSGLALARKLGLPLVLEVNGSEVWARKTWSRLHLERLAVAMEGAAFRGADRVVAVSEELAAIVIAAGADPARVVVNPNGVDLEAYAPGTSGAAVRAALGIPAGAVVCVFLGTFTRWHGVLFLAENLPALLARHPELRFLWIGDGDLRPEVERRLGEAGAAGRVHFTGLLPPARVPEHLFACDLAVSPHLPLEDGSPFFFSPVKLFEYMAAGRPVVASRLGQNARVVADGETGILYPPGDGAAFREAVSRLVEDPGLRLRMGRRARAAAEANHTWEANVRRALSGFVDLQDPADGRHE